MSITYLCVIYIYRTELHKKLLITKKYYFQYQQKRYVVTFSKFYFCGIHYYHYKLFVKVGRIIQFAQINVTITTPLLHYYITIVYSGHINANLES